MAPSTNRDRRIAVGRASPGASSGEALPGAVGHRADEDGNQNRDSRNSADTSHSPYSTIAATAATHT
jgi:hypothetical protein